MTRRTKRIILILFLVFFLIVVPVLAFFSSLRLELPVGGDRLAVVIDVRGKMLEYYPSFTPGFFLGRRELTLTELLAVLRSAARDERVEAVVLRVYPSGAGAAKCEEIRAAVMACREQAKQVIAYSPILFNHHYLVASAADSLFMPPSSYLMITGPASSALFLRGTFDKLGIRPNIDRIGNYKSAAETFTETERTPASREMARWLLDDSYERFVDTIAEARGFGKDTVRMHIDRGLFTPRSALSAGLIDGIRYWDEISGWLEAQGLALLPTREYIKVRELNVPAFSSKRVAVVHVGGTIVMGESGFDATFGQTVGAETVIRELRRVRDEDGIKAVVLRVDSPGGDGIAGAMISREVEITAAVKPVVVSMSDVAASGGYEISYRADRIVALPGSITGSIGSFTGKLNMRGFYDRIGFTKDEMGTGAKSLMNSNYRDYTSAEWKVLREEHREFYRHWIEDIARFRDMEVARVDSLAQGRVWTGRQARDRGLVDEEGGFDRAFEIACELAGIEDPDDAAVVHLPTRLSILQRILSGGYLEHTVAYLIHEALFHHSSGSRACTPQHYCPYRSEP